jgi:hypothetical protein
MNELVLLTRGGCANTDEMREHLVAALESLDQPKVYGVIDLDALSLSDPRRGYGTPTILRGGKDLFGHSEPIAPFDPPT